ncbi:hypothetical protein BC941DRAFT_414533 [Chlamydoabsidia padenii]|nr:hypothetical protein BC941DRAFT_414533 [Chlamydoabsidia padenii]
MSNDSNGPTKGTSVRRRKLSYDASFFKVDMKASTSITTEMDTKSSNLSTQKQQSLSPLYQNTPKPGIPSTSIVDPFAMMQQSVLSPPSTVSSKQPVYYRNGNAFYSDDLTSYPATIDSHEKQQLVEKLDAMYQDITGIDISNGKGQQRQQQRSRYTSDPLAPGSPHHSSPPSVSSSVLSNTSQQATDIYDRKLVNLSSRSSSFTSIFSTHTSRSSLSSISLEDVYDQPKAYGPSPRLTNGEMIPLLKNYLSRDQTDGEIACKIMSDLTTNQKSHTHRSLLSRHTFATDDHHHEQQRPSSTKIPTPMTTLSNPMVMTAMEKQLIFDHIAATLDSCSSQFGPRLQIIMDKQGILGNEVNQVVNLLAPRDPTDTSMLTKVYRETMDETSNFFNKLNTEIVEISTLVNAYRQKYHQQQQQVNASTGSNAISSHLDANTLLQRKLEKIQQEKEYWQRRTSELTDQINQFALKR